MSDGHPDETRADSELRLCLFGAATDTLNLGVTALSFAVMGEIARREPSSRLVVFDNGWGHSRLHVRELPLHVERCGARLSRRVVRPESYAHMRAATRLGGRGNFGARAVLEADAVLDITGGDSFSDIYGGHVFRIAMAPKSLALARGRPLVLLPQTYGPFTSPKRKSSAAAVVRAAHLAYARDEESYAAMQDLLGTDFDPDRHRLGVDVAFGLEPLPPVEPLAWPVGAWLADRRSIVGINASGLTVNDPASASRTFGLRVNTRQLLQELVLRLLREEPDVHVVLIPHVLGRGAGSDITACETVMRAIPPEFRSRIALLPEAHDPRVVKWVAAHLTWMAGIRMHATIAALSTGVPTAAVAYSMKTRSVFQSCGQADEVVDARALETKDALDRLWESWLNRIATAQGLAAALPLTLARARAQADDLVPVLRRTSDVPSSGRPSRAG